MALEPSSQMSRGSLLYPRETNETVDRYQSPGYQQKGETARELETVGESIGVQARICSSSRQPVFHHGLSVGVEFALLHILDHIEVA